MSKNVKSLKENKGDEENGTPLSRDAKLAIIRKLTSDMVSKGDYEKALECIRTIIDL